MKNFHIHIVFSLIFFTGCAQNHVIENRIFLTEINDYIHLRSYNTDTCNELWIFPDDSFFVRSFYFESNENFQLASGCRNGVFKNVISIVDSLNAWNLTSKSIEKDKEEAKKANRKKKNNIIDALVPDPIIDDIQIQNGKKQINVRFYATSAWAYAYPEARLVNKLNAIIDGIHENFEIFNFLP